MKPVDQTNFGMPGGNCFSACLASLLEIDLAEVPYFMGEADWVGAVNRWLQPRGLYALLLKSNDGEDYRFLQGFYILSGTSPRANGEIDPETKLPWQHSVIARGNKVVHDPHPSRAGILSRLDAVVLLPLDPAGLLREPRKAA